ncbi:hypothetical protein AeRB84_021077 [Aphanomyces euteiches]|nr:hypothetical protein AeRB84_021077 [Aphanomyces euteiches]
MEEHSPEKPAEAPSLRASKKSVATSTLTRRSARLKGNLPEFGLYEKPASTRKSVSKLSPLEISEERDSISSIPSSTGSITSKREAENDPDLSPQFLVPPKLPAVPGPSSGSARTSRLGRVQSRRSFLFNPEPFVEYPGDDDTSEKDLQILARFLDQAREESLVLHRQGFENLLVEQRLAQAAAYQRYIGMVETERNELRLENQEIRVLVTRILDQSRENEETRIKAFNDALVRLEETFSNQLEARVATIRESFKRQWADREMEIRNRASNSFLDSAEFQIAVENAIMAERQTLQNRLLRSEVEKEEVAKELEQTRSNLALSVNRIRIMEDDDQNFRQRLSDLNAEKEGLLRSLTALQYQGRDLQIRARDQHRDEMTRIRVDHQFDLERIRQEAVDENAQLRAAHLEEIEQIRSKSASVESGSEVTRLAEVNQRLLNDLARLELQHKDWETERRELQQHLDDQEAAYLELEDELRIVKSQHEQDFRQAYEDYQKQLQSTKESGSDRQQEILTSGSRTSCKDRTPRNVHPDEIKTDL